MLNSTPAVRGASTSIAQRLLRFFPLELVRDADINSPELNLLAVSGQHISQSWDTATNSP